MMLMNLLFSAVLVLGNSPSENRAAIQREIDAVSAAGGGRVTIPAGEWVTGSIELKSGVELHVPKGAVLRGSTSRTDYNPDDVFPENPSSAGEEWSGGHLIYAYKANDVAITGGGIIDGNGPAFFGECQYRGGWSDAWKYGLKLFPIDREWFRPGFMVAFFMCRNIRIQDVTLANTPCWTCHIRCSDGVSIRGVTIDADRTIANSDGFSIDCTRNVTVEKCIVKTGDDGFAIRASCRLHAETNLCENITVRDCDVWSCCNGVRLGVGSGTIRKVSFEDCRFHESGTAVAFTPAWVAGKRNVYIENTRFAHCYFGECRYPVVAFMPNADALVRDAVFEGCEMESMLPACINRTERAPVEGVRFVRCHRKTLFEGVKVRQDRRLLAEIKRQIRQEADLFATGNVALELEDCSPDRGQPKGVLILSFDDRNFDDWERAIPLFDRYGAHATFFVSGEINNAAVRTMKKLRAHGHSIGLHGLHHADADREIAAKGAERYYEDDILRQKHTCDVSYVPVCSFGYPNGRRTEAADKLFFDKGFERVRCSVPGATPYDPSGVKQADRKPLVANEALYSPAKDLPGIRLIRTITAGEAYHTDIGEILACLKRAAERKEVFAITSHGIKPDAKDIHMKTEWLEAILEFAKELDLRVIGFDELPPPEDPPEGTKWIWLPEPQPATTNVYAVFRTELPAGADALRVAVSGAYAAKVDGEVVAFGQYTDYPQDKTYTETRLQPSAKPRTLTVETWFSGNRFSSHYDGEPGLWAEILSSNRVVSASSRAWQVAPMNAYEFGPRTILFVSLNYTWAYDARKAWTPPDWKPARELVAPMMSARPRLRPVEPCGIVRRAVGRKIGGGADYALYDFGEEVTGMLSFRLSAPRGRKIEIVHGEFLNNGRLPDHALVGNPGNPRRVVDTFVADGASQYTHWFRRYGLRYLEFRWQGAGVAVEPPEILVTELAGLETPPFSCSDPLFEKMHEISCRTLRCCLHEKYENCPWREQSICEYDARNQMLFGYPLWGNYDRAAAMLRLFGAAEKDHGYLPAITPSMSGTTIPMFTFAWMGAVCDHAWYSGDDTLLREQLPRIRRMLKKILARRKGDLYTIPESLPGAWVWNYCEPGELEFRTNPPNAFYNLYLHEALTDLAKALRRLGDAAGAADYERTAAALAKACEVYWDEERGVYADSFASDGTREVFSGHVQALFLAQGLVPKARVPRVIAAIREGKVKMPELSALRYLVKGVFDHGTDDDHRWMHGKIREIYGGMIAAGATTWWEATSGENYGTSGSLCHGWSALPSWYIAEYILGVRPTSPGYATYEVGPRIPGITASGRVMTPKGPIDRRE